MDLLDATIGWFIVNNFYLLDELFYSIGDAIRALFCELGDLLLCFCGPCFLVSN